MGLAVPPLEGLALGAGPSSSQKQSLPGIVPAFDRAYPPALSGMPTAFPTHIAVLIFFRRDMVRSLA
jgi:hypothetical protein